MKKKNMKTAAMIGYISIEPRDPIGLRVQREALKAAGCSNIFSDSVSPRSRSRPGLRNALATLKAGDVMTVWRLDRLATAIVPLAEAVSHLRRVNADLFVIDEQIDTRGPHGPIVFHVIEALASFQSAVIRKRAGRKAGRTESPTRRQGRPPKLTVSQQTEALRQIASGEEQRVVAARFGVSSATIRRVINGAKYFNDEIVDI